MPVRRSSPGARADRRTSRVVVRVVPNRNPMLRIEGTTEVRSGSLFESRDGLGAHEVIVETPIHDQPLHTLDVDHLWRVLWAWRTRIQDLKRDNIFQHHHFQESRTRGWRTTRSLAFAANGISCYPAGAGR